jgi:hypothetical protein
MQRVWAQQWSLIIARSESVTAGNGR